MIITTLQDTTEMEIALSLHFSFWVSDFCCEKLNSFRRVGTPMQVCLCSRVCVCVCVPTCVCERAFIRESSLVGWHLLLLLSKFIDYEKCYILTSHHDFSVPSNLFIIIITNEKPITFVLFS